MEQNYTYPLNDHVPSIRSIPDMLAVIAENKPDGVAFRYRKGRNEIEEKTYSDVYREVRKAASWISRNYGKGQHIAVIGENSYEWLLAFFAVLSSGNTAVVIDKELPAKEVAWMIGKADVTAVFISKSFSDLLEGMADLKIMTLKGLQEAAQEEDEAFRLCDPEGDQCACIIFTSGTSGRSKGVMLSHENLTVQVHNCSQMLDATDVKTLLAVLPFHHAFGLASSVLMPYLLGISIFLNKSLKRVTEDLQLAKPDMMMVVPMFVEVFYKRIRDELKKSGRLELVEAAMEQSRQLRKSGVDDRRERFKGILAFFGGNLKIVVSGGAYLDPSYIRAYDDLGIDILNGYGATECSPTVSTNRMHCRRDGSVGMPIPGVRVRTAPDGEVQVKGPITMLGYYNDPEETAKALQDGWYCTGDLGHVDEDGFVFLTGRKKNLIILSNGENISPEELENDFRLDPGVNEVLIYDRKSKIIAEILPEEEFAGNQEYFNALMEKVNEGRPVYKQVTKVVLRTEDFIRNSSKKIVRYKNIPKEEEENNV